MPARPKWFERLREIVGTLEALPETKLLDRSTVETLFRVSKVRAIQVMRKLGGEQEVGGIWTIERDVLLGNLRRLRKSRSFGSFELEQEDKAQRLAIAIAEGKRTEAARKRKIDLRPIPEFPTLASIQGNGVEIGATETRLVYRSFAEFVVQWKRILAALEYDMQSFEALMGEEEPVTAAATAEKRWTVEIEVSPALEPAKEQETIAAVGA